MGRGSDNCSYGTGRVDGLKGHQTAGIEAACTLVVAKAPDGVSVIVVNAVDDSDAVDSVEAFLGWHSGTREL